MKKLILVTAILLSCSGGQNKDINDTFDTASRIGDHDAGAYIINPDTGLDLVNKIPDENYVYSQLAKNYANQGNWSEAISANDAKLSSLFSSFFDKIGFFIGHFILISGSFHIIFRWFLG